MTTSQASSIKAPSLRVCAAAKSPDGAGYAQTIESHLAWLLHLMSEYPKGWDQHCWRRAQDIAKSDPSMADLPRLLTEAMSK